MNNNSFDLPGFLLGEVYGPMKQEGRGLYGRWPTPSAWPTT